MATKQIIEYESLVSNFMRKYFNHCKMNKSGRVLISDIMHQIHDSLIKNFESEYGADGNISENEVMKCIQRAVSKTFPSGIRQLAVAEGNRQVSLYRSGVLEYDPAESLKALKSASEGAVKGKPKKGAAAKEAKRPASFFGPFSAATKKISSSMSPELTLANDAKQFIGFHLFKLTAEIADRAASAVGGKPRLESRDIMYVLPQFLTPDLLKNAYSEGNRILFHHTHGLQVFKPKKPSLSVAPLSLVEQGYPDKKKDSADSQKSNEVSPEMFRPGIKKMLADATNGGETVRINEGSKKVEEVLHSILDFLTDEVAENSNAQNTSEIDFGQVEEVLQKNFPPTLLQHAAYYGLSNVKDYVDGTLKYKKRAMPIRKSKPSEKTKKRKVESLKKSPKMSSMKRPIKHSQRSPKRPKTSPRGAKTEGPRPTEKEKSKAKELKFQKGILDLVQQSFRDNSVSIGREGTERINSFLTGLFNSLITELSGESTPLTAKDVRAKAEAFFPREMARHAVAAADGLIMTHAHLLQKKQEDSMLSRLMNIEIDPGKAQRDILAAVLQKKPENVETPEGEKLRFEVDEENVLSNLVSALQPKESDANAPTEDEIKEESASSEAMDVEDPVTASEAMDDEESVTASESSEYRPEVSSKENTTYGEETPSEEPASE